MLIVTHDRYLANRIADRILLMDGEGTRDFEGDWDAYKEFLAENSALKEKEKERETPAVKNEYVLSRERRSAVTKAKTALKRAEEQVHAEEKRLAELEARALSPENAMDFEAVKELYSQLETQRQRLENCYLDWEQAEAVCQALVGEDAN